MSVLSSFESTRFYIENQFNNVVNQQFNGSHTLTAFFLLLVANFGVYWSFGLLFLGFDLLSTKLKRYKINSNHKNLQLSTAKLITVIKGVVFNQLITFGLICSVLYIRNVYLKFESQKKIPSFGRFLLEFIVHFLLQETLFYFVHRLMHKKWFYMKFHKIHHEWSTPIAILALYTHPVEHIFLNMLPLIVAPIIFQSHILVIFFFLSYETLVALISHSGYKFPWISKNAVFHDWHHLKKSENYGAMGLWDKILGTDKEYQKAIQSNKNKTI